MDDELTDLAKGLRKIAAQTGITADRAVMLAAADALERIAAERHTLGSK